MPDTLDSPLHDSDVAALLEDVLVPLDDPAEQPGDLVGGFRLVEKLGEGGFGVVWRAEQAQPVQREVALKMIKLGMDTRQVLARFEQERRVLAAMTHPNIAAMLDAGVSPDGRPFFVMELVRGTPLTDYCAARKLPLRRRLELFRQVCLGVRHAHQKGIIHRDLKPSNLLVTEIDGAPVPKIIDFGIAKALTTDRLAAITQLTGADCTLGTPMYMAPEQLDPRAAPDTVSDVYALGVVLYELIAGVPPFDVATWGAKGGEEWRRAIRETQPKRPSTRVLRAPGAAAEAQPVIGTIPADLDWITLRALAKEPERRYQSAAEFAADVEAFLHGHPVAAHPPGVVYRANRWVRRHRLFCLAASVSISALVFGAALALWQARAARHAQRLAEHAAAQARAESARREATAAFLTRLLDGVAGEVEKGRNPEALQQALRDSQAALDELAGTPALRVELLHRIAMLWEEMGAHTEAIPLLREHAGLIERDAGADSDAARAARLEMLRVMVNHGSREDALRLAAEQKQRIEATGGRGSALWFDTLDEIARCQIKLRDLRTSAVAAADELVAEALRRQLEPRALLNYRLRRVEALQTDGRWQDCADELQRCQELASAGKPSASMLRDIERRTLFVLRETKDFTRAVTVQTAALARLRKDKRTKEKDVFDALISLSDLEVAAKQNDAAITHASEALIVARQRASASDNTQRDRLISAERARATALNAAGRHDEAIAAAQSAVAHAVAMGAPLIIRDAQQAHGEMLISAGRYDEAYAVIEETHRTLAPLDGNFRSRLEDLRRMVDVRVLQRRWDDALVLLRELWRLTKADKAASASVAHMDYVASHALRVWDAARAAQPGLPEFAELEQWRAARTPR